MTQKTKKALEFGKTEIDKSREKAIRGNIGFLGAAEQNAFVTSSGEQRCVSFSSLFRCGRCGSCHCHHGGRGHWCCGCVDAQLHINHDHQSLLFTCYQKNRQNIVFLTI